jgi:hypothetical protein
VRFRCGYPNPPSHGALKARPYNPVVPDPDRAAAMTLTAPAPSPPAAPSPPSPTVPRWVRIAAYAIPLLVLPSAAWRLSYILDVWISGAGPCDTTSVGEGIYIASLSVVSMGFALLTTGLVRPWGEVVPRWVPLAGGRPVPVRGPTIAAAAGATVIALIAGWFVINHLFGIVEGPTKPVPAGCDPPGVDVLAVYAPMLLWAPLLYAVTFQYHRRRTGAR